jgi:hypothetical protein
MVTARDALRAHMGAPPPEVPERKLVGIWKEATSPTHTWFRIRPMHGEDTYPEEGRRPPYLVI